MWRMQENDRTGAERGKLVRLIEHGRVNVSGKAEGDGEDRRHRPYSLFYKVIEGPRR